MLADKSLVMDDPDGDLVKLFEYAARRGVYTMAIYTQMTRPVVAALKKHCSHFYLGNNLGEAVMKRVPPGQRDMRQAANAWVSLIRKSVSEQWKLGQPHVTCTLTSLYAKYCMAAGMDIPMAEIFTMPCVDLQFSLLRGAARACNRDLYGGWIATGWFAGSNRDPRKPRRWQLSLNSGFLHGCNIMLQESGHWGLYEFRDFQDESHPLCQKYRRVQRAFRQFAEANPRPTGGPEVNVGLVQGNFDGYRGAAGHIWDQPGWLLNDHDRGWEFLNVFLPEAGRVADNSGMQDHRRSRFSGAPYGLVDIVPAEAPIEALARYRSLLFMGWNTMSPAIYQNLKEYVRRGGRLVMWATHLNASADRSHADVNHRFYRDGDYMDLFGARVRIPPRDATGAGWRNARTMVNTVQWVRPGAHRFPVGKLYYINWPTGGLDSTLARGVRVLAVTDSGRPFVTENPLGKGRAVLVHSYTPPGNGSYHQLAEDIAHAIGRRELGGFRLEGNPRLSYAVYGAGRRRVLYALNTNTEASESATLIKPAGAARIRLAPAELRLIRLD